MNLQKILPSKQFVKVFGGVTLGILAIVLIGSIANKKTVYKQNSKSKGTVLVVSDTIEKDTDQDGLKDWEEGLWGTDPNNPDTDGDGVTDGDEVKEIKKELNKLEINSSSNFQENNKTENMTKEILTIVSALQQSGELSAENQETVVNEISRFLEKDPDLEKKYNFSNLEIVQNPTKNQKSFYLNQMGLSIQKTTLSKAQIDSIINYDSAIEKKDFLLYSEIGALLSKEAQNMSNIKIPEDYGATHFRYINALNTFGVYFTNLSLYEEDPAKSLAALSQTDVIIDTYTDALNSLIDIIK